MAFLTDGRITVIDADGNPVSGGKVRIYRAGTTTPLDVYADASYTTPLSNPVIADSAGICPQIFGPEGVLADVQYLTSDDALIPGRSYENLSFVGASMDSREKLQANRTYYVATTGSDVANDGLSVGSPFLTPTKALEVAKTLDFNGFSVTVKLADGTYEGQIVIPPMIGQAGLTDLIIRGNDSNPENVVLTYGVANNAVVVGYSGTRVRVTGVKIVADADSYGLASWGYMSFDNVDFGAALYQVVAQNGGLIVAGGNYKISAGAAGHIRADLQSLIFAQNVTVTLTGTPAFSNAFASAVNAGVLRATGLTFSGSATGARYSATLNGVISTQGGGASYFPGDATGSTATGGQYA